MAARSVFILRRGLFGYRRADVVAALDEQRRQIESLAEAVDKLWQEKDRAWRANHAVSRQLLVQRSQFELELADERIKAQEASANARLDEMSAKLDELLARADGPAPAARPRRSRDTLAPIVVSELDELGTVLQRRLARRH